MPQTRQASIDLSIAWKRICKQLFNQAKTLEEFSNAAHWCGKAANVLRSISKAQFPAFAEWLYSHLDDIKNGTFVYDVRIPIPGVSTYPKSFIAKICHIINPHAYPLIWDSHVVDYLKKQNTPWNQAVNAAKARFQNAPDADIYLYDSTLWA